MRHRYSARLRYNLVMHASAWKARIPTVRALAGRVVSWRMRVWAAVWRPLRGYLTDEWCNVKPLRRNGWILPLSRIIFFGLTKPSIGRILPYIVTHCMKSRGMPGARRARGILTVDFYVAAWMVGTTYMSVAAHLETWPLSACVGIGLASYRLYEIFQSWMSQFVLFRWHPHDLYRSLVLVFLGYLEVAASFALLRHFIWGKDWAKSFLNSLVFPATIVPPTDGSIGGLMLAAQAVFVLLLLTAAISRIIGRRP